MPEGQSDKDKGKITIPWKWRDEEGELDLTDPNDLEKAKRLINQGYGYEKGQQELKAVKNEYEKVKEQVEYWNGLIEDGKDSGDATKVFAALEMSGLKMDKINPDDPDAILDEGNKELKELTKKVESLEGALYSKYTTDAHSQLEAKYSDGKFPEYNRKEIEDFANKKGIRDFEDAYWVKNKEELMKMEVKDDKDKDKKHSAKVKKVASKEPGSGEMPVKPVEKHTNYGKATDAWLEDPIITESLFI